MYERLRKAWNEADPRSKKLSGPPNWLVAESMTAGERAMPENRGFMVAAQRLRKEMVLDRLTPLVNTSPVNNPEVNTDRKTYMRDYMKRRRDAN